MRLIDPSDLLGIPDVYMDKGFGYTDAGKAHFKGVIKQNKPFSAVAYLNIRRNALGMSTGLCLFCFYGVFRIAITGRNRKRKATFGP